LDDPNKAIILGESIIDEIYFRILSDEQKEMLNYHLQQRGQIHEILRTVNRLLRNSNFFKFKTANKTHHRAFFIAIFLSHN
jgi:hypothetical protein